MQNIHIYMQPLKIFEKLKKKITKPFKDISAVYLEKQQRNPHSISKGLMGGQKDIAKYRVASLLIMVLCIFYRSMAGAVTVNYKIIKKCIVSKGHSCYFCCIFSQFQYAWPNLIVGLSVSIQYLSFSH